MCILASQISDFRGQKVKQVLVQWSNSPPKDVTQENFPKFWDLYKQLDLEDKVVFKEKGSDSYATQELDSTIVNKQVEEWAANKLAKQEEAQRANEDQPTTSSCAWECVEGDIADDTTLGSSRICKKLAWTKDYIMEQEYYRGESRLGHNRILLGDFCYFHFIFLP